MNWIIGERATEFKVGDYLCQYDDGRSKDRDAAIFQIANIDVDMDIYLKVVEARPGGVFESSQQDGNLLRIVPNSVPFYRATKGLTLEEGYNRL